MGARPDALDLADDSGEPQMSMSRRLAAEFIGTFWLVFGGCGTAVLAANSGAIGIALAFGFALLTAAFALQHISGAHFNPAVTFGLFAAKRFAGRDVIPYWIAQTAAAIAAAAVLYLIARGLPAFDTANGFALNGYGSHSPLHYPLAEVLMSELVLSFFFVTVAIGATSAQHRRARPPASRPSRWDWRWRRSISSPFPSRTEA